MNERIEIIHHGLAGRLAHVRRQVDRAATARGLLLWGTLGVAMLLLLAGIESLAFMGPVLRTVLFWLAAAGLGTSLAALVGVPLLRLSGILKGASETEIAAAVGTQFPGVADRLVNVLQLRGADPSFSSPALVEAAFLDLDRETQGLDFAAVVDRASVRRARNLFLTSAGVMAALLVLLPSALVPAAERLLRHGERFDRPASLTFLVDPGNKEIVRGETVEVRITVEGEHPDEVVLAVRPEGQVNPDRRRLTPAADGSFRDRLPSVRTTTEYFVEALETASPEYRLHVSDRPVARLLRIHLTPPAYSRVPASSLEDNVGSITALKGTRVNVEVEANHALAAALLVFNDSSRVPMRVNGLRAGAEWTVRREGSYIVRLADPQGLESIDPVEYAVTVFPDRYPTAAIPVPGMNLDVTEASSLSMVFSLTDDFGCSGARLAYRLAHSRYGTPSETFTFVELPMPADERTQVVLPYTWDLKPLALVPEDQVQYYVEVFDNDRVSGPKSAVSETYTLRLPSLDEVFADVDRGNEQTMETLQETMRRVEEARKDAEELRNEMRKEEQKMDWQDQQKTQQLLKNYEQIQKKLAEAEQAMKENVRTMQDNKVLSPETMEKFQELQQLMQEINSPELADALKRMQDAMQQMNPDMMRQALTSFQFSEENFRKGIERTLNLLKRIQAEQKLDELARRVDEMRQQQEEAKRGLEETGGKPDAKTADELARRQEELRKAAAEAAKTLDDVQKRMEEFPSEMPLQEMAEARKSLQESGLMEQLSEIAEQMRSGQFSEASEGQQQAMQKMDRTAQQLQQAKQAMQRQQQRQIVNEMRRALQDLVALSRKQEDLKNQTRGLDPSSPQMRQNAQEQMDVMRDLGQVAERMSRVGQKSFAVSPEMGKSLGDAMRSMGQSVDALEDRNASAASQQQGAAMGSLNAAAQQVQEAINGMMQGGGQGGGMGGFMMRLQGLTGQQQGINQGTRGLQSMTQEQAAGMARMAAEQAIVRKSLEQLSREAANRGELSKMLGDLNQIAREMMEVQSDLSRGDVQSETIQRQERIVSRLLDAQRSARERDFEKRRKADVGLNVRRGSPPGLLQKDLQGRPRRDLLKELDAGYTRDYQELIRRYFEAMERMEHQETPGP
jgi:hypothetical protein